MDLEESVLGDNEAACVELSAYDGPFPDGHVYRRLGATVGKSRRAVVGATVSPAQPVPGVGR